MDQKRIRGNKVSFDHRFPRQAGHWHCPALCLKYRRLGPTPDLLNQNLGVPGIWISESLHSWFCWVVVFLALLRACCPVLGVLVGRVSSSSGPVGCYDAGHGALVPRFPSLAMAQLPSTSQATALKEGKSQTLTAKGKSLHPPCSPRCGGLADGKSFTSGASAVPCRAWGKNLTWGRLKWTIFVLLVSRLGAVGCWVCFFSAVGSSAVNSSRPPLLKDAFFTQSSLLKWSLIWGRRCPTEMVKSILVSRKCLHLSWPKCPLDSPCQVPWSSCKIRYLHPPSCAQNH